MMRHRVERQAPLAETTERGMFRAGVMGGS